MDCERYGADGITVHPRPDQRHVRYADLRALKEVVKTELNVEGYPSEKFMSEVLSVRPHQCTLVPDPPGVLTSSEGWHIDKEANFLKEILSTLKEAGIRTSLFVDPVAKQIEGAHNIGADRIEIYTGNYALEYADNRENAIKDHVTSAALAASLGLGVNAGHDLNLENLAFYADQLPSLLEVSIGHALISDALYFGISNVIGMYKNLL